MDTVNILLLPEFEPVDTRRHVTYRVVDANYGTYTEGIALPLVLVAELLSDNFCRSAGRTANARCGQKDFDGKGERYMLGGNYSLIQPPYSYDVPIIIIHCSIASSSKS